MVRWWWPGGDVTDEEIRREVRLLDEANFGGGEIQAFRIGLPVKLPPDVEARVNDYLTPAFFGHVRAAIEEARRREMWMDLTLGSGWPFGGGNNITPELASMELLLTHLTVRGPQKFHQKLAPPPTPPSVGTALAAFTGVPKTLPPGWQERIDARKKPVAVVAVRGTEPELSSASRTRYGTSSELVLKPGVIQPQSAIVLTDKLAADGTLDWEVPEGEWQLFEFVEAPADLRVIGGVGASPQLVLDHMKPAAVESHIHAVGDRAKEFIGDYFGKGLRSVFCDSLEVTAYMVWGERFFDDFKRLRGYDITPYLPLVRKPGFDEPYGSFDSPPLFDNPEIGDRVRHDYWQTVSDVMIANFYQPLDEWAKKNHVQARVQAHGAQADVLKIYGMSDIPETEQLYAGGTYDFLKAAASGAHIYGRRLVSSESFVKRGNPYITTPEKLKAWSDELLTAGINQIIYHGYPYEHMDRPEPGWHPFSDPLPFSSDMNQHNTYWEFIPRINAYITRLQYVSQTGENVAQVALYRSALAYETHNPQPPDPEIDRRLMESGYNYDHVNNDALLKSHVESGKLVVPSGARYNVLVLLDDRYLPVEVAEKIAAFRGGGLPVVFVGTVPSEEAGLNDWEMKSRRIRDLFHGIAAQGDANGAVAEIRKSLKPDLEFVKDASTTYFFHKKLAGMDAYFLRNASERAADLEVVFPASAPPENWDPWTGEIAPEYEFERTPGGVHMHFELPPFGSRLIVFDSARTHPPKLLPARPETVAALNVSGKWTLEGGGQRLEVTDLVDWTQTDKLRSFSGKAHYETRFTIDAGWLSKAGRVELDLGVVRDVAQVRLNGKPGPVLLLRPYRAEVTSLLKAGENVLEISVTNGWINQLLARGAKLNWPGEPPIQPASSGLLGPVRLVPR
jgi:glycosyl hydrolase family 106( putative alpha-L-rhamnosidase)